MDIDIDGMRMEKNMLPFFFAVHSPKKKKLFSTIIIIRF